MICPYLCRIDESHNITHWAHDVVAIQRRNNVVCPVGIHATKASVLFGANHNYFRPGVWI